MNRFNGVRWRLALTGLIAIASSGCMQTNSKFASTKNSYTVTHHPLEKIDGRMLVFRQRAEGNSAIFESDRLTLVFPDLKRTERNSFDSEDLSIQIAGEGRSETTRSCNRNGRLTIFRAVYFEGVSTITFCGREVKLANDGRTVIVGQRTIDLREEDRPVTVLAQLE